MSDPAEARRVAVGMLMILASGIIFAFMSALTRVVSDAGVPSMQIVLISGVTRWIGLAALLLRAREHPFGPRSRIVKVILIVRSLCGCIAFSCATYAFGVMPIGDATAIFLTSPVWAALLARVALGEKLHPLDALAIFFALVGVVLVARPTAIFGAADAAIGDSVDNVTSGRGANATDAGTPMSASSFGAWCSLVGAVFAGSVAVLVRALKSRGKIHPAVVAHAYAAITVLVAPLPLVLLPGQGVVLTGVAAPQTTWPLCLAIGVLAIPNQLLVNAGLLRTPAALGSMMRLVDVPAAFVLQLACFGQRPRLSSVGGAALIVLCTAGSAYRKWRVGTASASGGGGGGGGGSSSGTSEAPAAKDDDGATVGAVAGSDGAKDAATAKAKGGRRWAPGAFGRLREEEEAAAPVSRTAVEMGGVRS